MAKKFWIAEATKNKGGLRRALGTKKGKKISSAALKKAAKSGSTLMKRRANLAMTLAKMRKGK